MVNGEIWSRDMHILNGGILSRMGHMQMLNEEIWLQAGHTQMFNGEN